MNAYFKQLRHKTLKVSIFDLHRLFWSQISQISGVSADNTGETNTATL